MVQVQLYYLGQLRMMEMARMQRLPYHALLGRDAPAFREVVALFLPDLSAWAAPAEEAAGPSGMPQAQQIPKERGRLEQVLKDPQ